MVDVPGAELQNAAPPTVALVLLGVAQVGVVLAVRDRSTRWLRRPGPWRAVVAVNSVVLSVFLWHLAAAVVAAGVLYAGGLLPVVPVGSPEWLALRPVWLAACAGALVPLVAAAASLELRLPGARTGDRITSPSARWAGWVGAVVALAGLLDLALAGRAAHGPLGPPTESLVAVAVGLVLTSLAGRARS
jgi:hypothetical protein